jgi:acyl carrier protein
MKSIGSTKVFEKGVSMSVLEQVVEMAKEFFGKTEVDANTTLEDLGADSIDKVSLILDIETQFEIEMSDNEQLSTIGDIVEVIEKKLDEKSK